MKMSQKLFKENIRFITLIFLLSSFLLCILHPDLWFYHTHRLMVSHETEIPFESTYILVSQFLHGGIQLWDPFDQVNNGFFVSTNGVYGVVNIIAAVIFILLSPFMSHPAEGLYHTHILVFYGLNSLLRIIGGYLLLSKLIKNKMVIGISLVFLNVMLTSYLGSGFEPEGVYSFFPLLLYFILSFFETMRWRSFLLVGLIMTLCLVSSPYFTLGYFYQAVHFFIISAVVLFIYQRGWRKFKNQPKGSRQEIYGNIGILLCILFILLPYYFWGQTLTHDFYVDGSGLGGTKGRFNNILNFKGYFNIFNKGFANSFEFLGTSLDYHHNVWGTSWSFIGASSLFLSLIGFILSKDKRKYVFAGTILGILLINNAWFLGNLNQLDWCIKYADLDSSLFWARGMHVGDWWSYGFLFASTLMHGLNALTNPFCFLVRSFHMTSLLMPMVFFPLVAMGLDALVCLWQHKNTLIHVKRRWVLLIIVGGIFLWGLVGGTNTLSVGMEGYAAGQSLKEYLLSITAVFFFIIAIPCFTSLFNPRWLWALISFALIIDFISMRIYVERIDRNIPDTTLPVRISPAYTHQAIVPDFQNPEILPFREFNNVQDKIITPMINGGPLCMYGAFYQYSPIGRFFHPWSIYEPRHIAYKDLFPDTNLQEYLRQNSRRIFFADFAFDSRYVGMDKILRYNITQRVIRVEPNTYNKGLLKTTDAVYIGPLDFKQRFYQVRLPLSDKDGRYEKGGWVYTLNLPKNFPFYLSTTVFTYDDASWHLYVNDKALEPAQGKLAAPYTFDVQNIRTRNLTLLLPDCIKNQAVVTLQVKMPDRITGVWKNTYDDLGFIFQSPKEGWIVFNFPYDEKWELMIDQHKQAISRVNGSFLGAPISAGTHEILIRYWPHTLLRFWIFLSMCLSVGCFFGIIFNAIRKESVITTQGVVYV